MLPSSSSFYDCDLPSLTHSLWGFLPSVPSILALVNHWDPLFLLHSHCHPPLQALVNSLFKPCTRSSHWSLCLSHAVPHHCANLQRPQRFPPPKSCGVRTSRPVSLQSLSCNVRTWFADSSLTSLRLSDTAHRSFMSTTPSGRAKSFKTQQTFHLLLGSALPGTFSCLFDPLISSVFSTHLVITHVPTCDSSSRSHFHSSSL